MGDIWNKDSDNPNANINPKTCPYSIPNHNPNPTYPNKPTQTGHV